MTAEVSRRCRGTTQPNQEQKLDQSTRCRKAIEDAEPFLINPPGIEKLSGLQLEKVEVARQTARYRGGIEEVSSQLLKAVFQDEKNTDKNAIQHATQPMIQTTYLSSLCDSELISLDLSLDTSLISLPNSLISLP